MTANTRRCPRLSKISLRLRRDGVRDFESRDRRDELLEMGESGNPASTGREMSALSRFGVRRRDPISFRSVPNAGRRLAYSTPV